MSFTWEEFLALPRTEVTCDIHCVTRWSRLDNRFEGVPIREIMRRVRVKPEAKHVLIHADPDYTTNLPLEDLVDDDVILALTHDGQDLTPDHGGPLRLVVPKLYFWKSAKWLRGFEFLDVNPPGFWEVNGYHMHADPWTEERYSDQEGRHAAQMQKMRAEAARKLPRAALTGAEERPRAAGRSRRAGRRRTGCAAAPAPDLDQAPVGQALGHLLGDLGREDVALRAAHHQGRAGDARQRLPQIHGVAPPATASCRGAPWRTSR